MVKKSLLEVPGDEPLVGEFVGQELAGHKLVGAGDGPRLGEVMDQDLAGYKLVWVYDLRLINDEDFFLPACFKDTDEPVLVLNESLLERVRSVLPDLLSETHQTLCLLHVESGTAWCVGNRKTRQFTEALSITSQEKLYSLLEGGSESFAWKSPFDKA